VFRALKSFLAKEGARTGCKAVDTPQRNGTSETALGDIQRHIGFVAPTPLSSIAMDSQLVELVTLSVQCVHDRIASGLGGRAPANDGGAVAGGPVWARAAAPPVHLTD
jgi:hypothetical protein